MMRGTYKVTIEFKVREHIRNLINTYIDKDFQFSMDSDEDYRIFLQVESSTYEPKTYTMKIEPNKVDIVIKGKTKGNFLNIFLKRRTTEFDKGKTQDTFLDPKTNKLYLNDIWHNYFSKLSKNDGSIKHLGELTRHDILSLILNGTYSIDDHTNAPHPFQEIIQDINEIKEQLNNIKEQ